jgi:SAM-dependent methyltransferase
MTARTLWNLARSGQLVLLAAVARLQHSYYRFCFLGAAAESGVLGRLASGPVTFESLAADLAPHPDSYDGLRAWLDFGVRLGVLSSNPTRGYALRGWLARRLADPKYDAILALVQESAGLHHALLTESLARLQQGRLFTLADQQGELIARSSRVLEPLLFEVIDDVIPTSRPVRLLEIGCGSGVYLHHAAKRNPALTGVGLELQADVADYARENLRHWRLVDRISVHTGDVRTQQPRAEFDIATLHNNIYYFPVGERISLFAHIRQLLRPDGLLLVTTGCQGGRPQTEILNLWAAMTAGCGRLPTPEELERQLAEGGYVRVRSRSLIPGDRYYAFVAENA